MSVKKWDKIIIVSLLLLSFVPHLLFGVSRLKNYDRSYAVVSVGGKVEKKIPLTGQVKRNEYVIETAYGTNFLVVENEQIAMIEANCPDKVCMEPGYIKKPGESLVCLPNRLYVEVQGVSTEENEIDIKAY